MIHALFDAPDPGTSLVDRAADRIFTKCEMRGFDEGVTQGTHRVHMRATIPGTELDLRTNEVKVTLECPATSDAGALDATVPTHGAIDTEVDAAIGGGPATRDASISPSTQIREQQDDSGCHVASARIPEAWPLILVIGLLARRRRVVHQAGTSFRPDVCR